MNTRRPMTLSAQNRREWIARLLLCGWTAERIARKFHCTARTIRKVIATPTFQARFRDLQRDQLKRVDLKLARLLYRAVRALARQLRHRDWKARDAAIDKVLRLHAKYVERIDVTGSACTLTHPSSPLQQPMDDMSPEQRLLAREFLKSMRAQRQPPRILGVDSGDQPVQT